MGWNPTLRAFGRNDGQSAGSGDPDREQIGPRAKGPGERTEGEDCERRCAHRQQREEALRLGGIILGRVIGDEPGVLHFLFDPVATGVFLSFDPKKTWVFMKQYDPNVESVDSYDFARCEQLIKEAIFRSKQSESSSVINS